MRAMLMLSPEARSALREQVLDRLSGIDDVWMALSAEDFEAAERYGREFADYLRLMEDLGWVEDPPREVALRMPTEELRRAIDRLCEAAKRSADYEKKELARDSKEHHTQLVIETCERCLSELSPMQVNEVPPVTYRQ